MADVVCVAESLRLGRVVVIGQSLGGQVALLVAVERPDLVRGLVRVDAHPGAGGDLAAIEAVGESLRQWPVPFASREAAVEFFRGRSLNPEAWADGLERRKDGWWPRFDVDVMVRTHREADSRPYWDEWDRITCPTLIVRAGNGIIPAADAEAMTSRNRRARLVEIADRA